MNHCHFRGNQHTLKSLEVRKKGILQKQSVLLKEFFSPFVPVNNNYLIELTF